MSTSIDLSSRVENASKIMKISSDELKKRLDGIGISDDDFGFQLLEADTTSIEMIKNAISVGSDGYHLNHAVLAASASILKGKDPFTKKEQISPPSTQTTGVNNSSGLEQVLRDNIPIGNKKNRELLEEFIKDEDISIQKELDRRGYGKPFIVLGPNDKILLEPSLDLLKIACRGEQTPEMISIGQERFLVYPIQNFRKENRIREESPFIPGALLFNGYCEKSDTDFSKVSQEARQFLRLIVEFTSNEDYKNSKFHSFSLSSYSDRKAVLVSAINGIEDLKKTWPAVSRVYEEKKDAGSLPSLKVVLSITPNKNNDPFFPGKKTAHQNY